ncbi:MAG: glycoside hydrolase family 99-like domain-containing protein [Desulfovibrionaceae bacterium]|nr:glycoside hydrolase family 99-like domain-containing protein [Desulfovibrionaceae bacterium]
MSLKPIAFYLPQYHVIPENDAWWGQGFTEWNNVETAAPLFDGHYQPHVPAAPLGRYDLRDPEVATIQAELARAGGIHGFCYYHYWFNGKKLLDTPLANLLASGRPDFPFCLCWANSDWTRIWYGQSKEILIAQEYSDAAARALIRDLAPAMADPRYIRLNGRPIFLVFQSELIPDALRHTDLWREEALRLGIGAPYLIRMESFCWDYDPRADGFDAACEFAPDFRMCGPLLSGDEQPRRVDYLTTARNMLAKPAQSYPRYSCVFPGWDNTPRYKKAALTFTGATPAKFAHFLRQASLRTIRDFPPEQRLLFVNAWNEWGEGCHLEPDVRHGDRYLRIFREVMESLEE